MVVWRFQAKTPQNNLQLKSNSLGRKMNIAFKKYKISKILIAGMLPAFHNCMLRPVNTVQYNVSPYINTTTDPCQPRV